MGFCMELSLWGKCKLMGMPLFMLFFVLLGSNSRLRSRLKILFALSRLLILSMYLSVASILTWSFVPRFLKLMIRLSSQVSASHDHNFLFILFSTWNYLEVSNLTHQRETRPNFPVIFSCPVKLGCSPGWSVA